MKPSRFQVRLVAGLCLTAFAIRGSSQETVSPSPQQFLLKAVETEIDLSPQGVTSNDCLVVLPDGAFRLLRRFQQLPSPSATRVLYEGQVSEADLDELKGLLNADQVAALPRFEYESPPGDFYEIHGWVAQIARPAGVQEVGYYRWASNHPQESFDFAPAALKAPIDSAAKALQPLAEWFHRIESARMKPSDTKSIPCDLEDGSQ